MPAICPTSLMVLRGESTLPSSSRTASRLRKPTLRPTRSVPTVARVMIPRPPTWIRNMMTTLPKRVNVDG